MDKVFDEHEHLLRFDKPASAQENDTVEIESQDKKDSLRDRWSRWVKTIDR